MLLQIVAWLYFWATAALTRCLPLSLSPHCPLPLLPSLSPLALLCLLYALRRGYADQCPLNLSSASVCAKITGDSPPAASSANIRSLLLQGVPFVVSTPLTGRLIMTNPQWAFLQEIQIGFCMKVSFVHPETICISHLFLFVHLFLCSDLCISPPLLCILVSIYSRPDWFYCPICPKLSVCIWKGAVWGTRELLNYLLN